MSPPAPRVSDYALRLYERHGIESRRLTGCDITASLAAFAADYCSVMDPVIAAEVSPAMFDVAEADASAAHAATTAG